MPLHLTKVAFACDSVDFLRSRLEARAAAGGVALTTRYLPKRHAEIDGGSLFWILKHQLVGRSPILGFGEAEGGRTAILLEPKLVLVQARPKRAHQGWRYLEDADAPRDLGDLDGGADELPPSLMGELAGLGLL
ncbi:DUF1489 family protein [Sphingomonas sp. ABOLD]|uniref:DUF1489 family protein n=1 Tax=Sphingomonas trueperi TaxID=53317 RepID=A0A7X5XW95_9SPHN|nr:MULTISPECIES: DUF1489 domain-containing protein [unclassified Sphingomonas]NJB96103.1 hypothetical protein [Sphingomonas trueperi]RSV44875.1 DUF1489 family protein [Sphingomonas sp. ABOLE]RSV51070.1 DUF1489 family protein [Sphingomonas sp. ABOLD]